MRVHRLLVFPVVATLIGLASSTTPAADKSQRNVNGTIWVANRGSDSIRGFEASTGDVVATVAMRTGSQPGDLVYANHKLYVAEERATPPAIAIVDVASAQIINRIFFAPGSRPHHVHASASGELVAVGLYGTDRVAVIETENDTVLGEWDSDPATTNGRVHAGVFSQDGEVLYLLNDATGKVIAMEPRTSTVLWSMDVPGAHEMVVAHNGKTAFVSRRPLNALALVNLEDRSYTDVSIGLPDTLRLSANEKLLTIGLRTSPAQLAVMDTETLAMQIVDLAPANSGTTTGGHQWTTPNGQYTFASYEGTMSAGLVVIDHGAGHKVVQRLLYPGAPHGVTHALPQ
jgi:DNA-binding beta-propeller fold protein YncE